MTKPSTPAEQPARKPIELDVELIADLEATSTADAVRGGGKTLVGRGGRADGGAEPLTATC